jgi:hypothetical protein
MVKVSNGDGVIYKLESSAGTLLGTIAIPAHWENSIRRYGRVELAVREEIYHRDYASVDAPLCRSVKTRHAALTQSNGNHPGALVLCGLTLEEFETLPGCLFMPGAAYLRSVLA